MLNKRPESHRLMRFALLGTLLSMILVWGYSLANMTEWQINTKAEIQTQVVFSQDVSQAGLRADNEQTLRVVVGKDPEQIGTPSIMKNIESRASETKKVSISTPTPTPKKRLVVKKKEEKEIPREFKAAPPSKKKEVIVKFIMKSNHRVSGSFAENVADYVMIASQQFNVDPFLITAIIRKESTFNHRSTSHAGAIGLMQVMWRVHGRNIRNAFKDIDSLENMYDPYNNIMVGTWLYSWKWKAFGCHRKALNSYLGGYSDSYVNTVFSYQKQMYAMLRNM